MSRGTAVFPAEGFQKLLEAEALRAGLALLEPTFGALARYLSELDAWRRRINLTGNLAPEELASHAVESVAAASLIAHGARLLDIGSGGGFPGLPLSIARPDLSVTLLEPRSKRASFLRHVIRTVAIENATVLRCRVEELKSPDYDAATTRGVREIAEVIDGAPFLSESGILFAWTTEPERLAASLSAHFSLERADRLPHADRRVIAVFRKKNA
jgi:16S rRNA (guanine527-N7)-methyltransferase